MTNTTSISLEERTCRAETQLLELEGRRLLRKEFFPRHLAIIETSARAIVNTRGGFTPQAYDSSDEEISNPQREMDPDERSKLLKILFNFFDVNQDGYWDMTETTQWLNLIGKRCDLHTWESFCDSYGADRQSGVSFSVIDNWYESDALLDEHISYIHTDDGVLDHRISEIPESTLQKIESLLDQIFEAYLTTDAHSWEYKASQYWFQEFTWFNSFQEVGITEEHLHNGLSRDDVASIYNNNEYLLLKHATQLSHPAGDNTFNAEDDEDEHEYRIGGYHRVEVGDTYNEHYQITKKLGWGNFSTVWLAHDTRTASKSVALKIGKGSEMHKEMCNMEVDALRRVNTHFNDCDSPMLRSFAKRVVRMNDYFIIDGPHGEHPTMAIEPVGPDILKLLTAHEFVGVAPCIVKAFIKDMLEGLAFIHSMGLIHADVKPENVLIQTLDSEGNPLSAEKTTSLLGGTLFAEKSEDQSLSDFMRQEYGCKITDFGSSRWHSGEKSRTQLQTLEYRAPEVILGGDITPAIDVWSVACTCFELLTGSFLFNPKSYEGHQETQHIRLFISALGSFPRTLVGEEADTLNKSVYFSPDGEFLAGESEKLPLIDMFIHNGADPEQAQELFDFLSPMLELDPAKRATAEEASKHPWLTVVEEDARPYTAPARTRLKKLVSIDYGDLEYSDHDGEDATDSVECEYPPPPPSPPKNLESPDIPIDAHTDPVALVPAATVRPSKDHAILDLRQRAEYADLRREELVSRRALRTEFFPLHLEAIKQTARIRA
eukprot:TRINITY_DN3058_c1_g1_i1.p1 TRINITY_DN3058_c1_g1~~TRINITY_DN3058_c1_g1_i1.p1  ORF type:complete len:773 (+),score=144.33 TRINITY_DN3058_c1_g1_i1:1366-3684(+)